MGFKNFRKRKEKTKGNENPKITPKTQSPLSHLKKETYVSRLFANGGEGLFRVLIWLPFFAGAWLVSGPLIQNIPFFSLLLSPLLGLFLYIHSDYEKNKTVKKKLEHLPFLLVVISLLAFFLYYIEARLLLVCNFFLVALSFLIQNLLSERKQTSLLIIILRGLLPVFQVVPLFVLGLLSQIDFKLKSEMWFYFIPPLIPALVLSARAFLLESENLKALGWKLEQEVDRTTTKNKKRPASLTRLIVGLLVIGPAIPSLLLPFPVLPTSLFLVTLAFLRLPRLAEEIQGEFGSMDYRLEKVTRYAGIVELLTIVALFLA